MQDPRLTTLVEGLRFGEGPRWHDGRLYLSDIADGKVDGDNVSWKASITTPFPMTLEFSGKVEGDKISGSVKAGSFGSFPFSGVRA